MKRMLIALMVTSIGFAVHAGQDWSKLKSKKQTQAGLYMTPQQAQKHMQTKGSKTLFVDVRSRPEVNFLGMPTLADANVPYMKLNEWFSWNKKKQSFQMEVNSGFASEIESRLKAKGLTKDDEVILICRSGSRSSKAADLLTKLGYNKVYSIPEGFEGDKSKAAATKGQRVINGWKNAGLPWSYKLQIAKMYQVGE